VDSEGSMMESLLGICGGIGHGKDTAADFLVEAADYTKLSMAHPLKEAVSSLFDVPARFLYGTQEDKSQPIPNLPSWTGRSLLEYFGTDVCRKVDPNIWIRLMLQEVKATYGHVVIPDVRFQNECDMIHQLGGQVIKVVRTGHPETGTEHPSGKWVAGADRKVDRVIVAGNVPELQTKIGYFVGLE
jgi:hypothetical protein